MRKNIKGKTIKFRNTVIHFSYNIFTQKYKPVMMIYTIPTITISKFLKVYSIAICFLVFSFYVSFGPNEAKDFI